jgi:RNA polymerase sigma factor (sigma-70 family)
MLKFLEVYESFAEDVYRFCYWLSGDPNEAEDITSETFIRAWVSSSAIRTETLKAYLFTIARNLYLEHQRKRKREVFLDDIYTDPNPGPEKIVESQHDLQGVVQILQTLPEVDRAAFILRIQHGLPYAEIARVLKLNLITTKVKVHRVRKKIIATYADEEVN